VRRLAAAFLPLTKTFTIAGLCLTALLAFFLRMSTVLSDDSNNPFPMSAGTRWIYKGTVRWTSAGSNFVRETKVTWQTEVRRSFQHGEIRVAIISGFPSDLNWSEGKPEASQTLVVESGGKFYRMPDSDFGESLRRLESPSDNLAGMLIDDNLFLKWPLNSGEKFCDADGMARPDTMYCWLAESVIPARPSRIEGATLEGRHEYALIYRTLPDHIRFTFVPGIGITTYEYHHHGTVADTELSLVNFHPTL
jgi:hypothetical protein